MSLPQRVNLITLAVSSVKKSTAFYEALGWKASPQSGEKVSFFVVGTLALALYERHALAKDAGLTEEGEEKESGATNHESEPATKRVKKSTDLPRFSLTFNVRTAEEVAPTMEKFVKAGGTEVRASAQAFPGWVSGYVADVDGHLWEVVYNSFNPMDDDGFITFP